jgi:alpha-glucan phosphorylase-like protein
MWKGLWPDRDPSEVPIGHITNGVHPLFWMAPASQTLFDRHLPDWRDHLWDNAFWQEGVMGIPDAALWELRNTLLARLLDHVEQHTGKRFDPHALTIGFARRFATYKRGDLLFSDADRLDALLNGDSPVQILFSGKAHPRDVPGKDLISRVIGWSNASRFRDRVAFIPDYDMHVGGLLTSGVDLWLNNPRRPKEASGTSGQKVPLNGGLNLSVLDGWWPEAWDETNGWAIGDGQVHTDVPKGDTSDAQSLYEVLENQIVPSWSDRDANGLPIDWLTHVRRSIATCVPVFNSHRMVRDYVQQMYRA